MFHILLVLIIIGKLISLHEEGYYNTKTLTLAFTPTEGLTLVIP